MCAAAMPQCGAQPHALGTEPRVGVSHNDFIANLFLNIEIATCRNLSAFHFLFLLGLRYVLELNVMESPATCSHCRVTLAPVV